MTAVLRPVSNLEPRPTLSDLATIRAALAHNREAVLAWVRKNKFSEDDSDEEIVENLAQSFKLAEHDPARAVRMMEMVHHWKIDSAILWHLQVVKKNLLPAASHRVRLWVVKTGIRFPAKKGELVTYVNGTVQRNARVVEVRNTGACAVVEHENGSNDLINAEQVIANRTTGQEPKSAVPLALPAR